MPVFTSLRESKRRTRNRQRWLYGYSVDANAMTYLEGSGSLMEGEVPSDLLASGIDFDQADNMATGGTAPSYNSAPLITSMSLNGSMGNTLSFNFSYLMKIMESYSDANDDNISEPSTPPLDYGTTRYYCQGAGEPEQFSWSVNTNVVNSGCIVLNEAETGNVAKVKINSLNANLTQYYEGALPTSGEDVTFNSDALFLPPACTLLAASDFSVSESGTEYTTEHTDGWNFVTAECDGIPEIPTDWIEFPIIAST